MKRGTLALLLLLGCATVGFARGPDYCVQCACVADNSCTTHSGCGQLDGCNSVNFTANCGGTYVFKVVMKCSSGDVCRNCVSCAVITHAGEPPIAIQAGCRADDCELKTQVPLAYGEQYTLSACLRACQFHSCDECTSCTVQAFVYKQASDCNPMPPCDP